MGLNLVLRKSRICRAICVASEAVNDVPAAGMNTILLSSSLGLTSIAGLPVLPNGLYFAENVARTSPWMGAGKAAVPGSGA